MRLTRGRFSIFLKNLKIVKKIVKKAKSKKKSQNLKEISKLGQKGG